METTLIIQSIHALNAVIANPNVSLVLRDAAIDKLAELIKALKS